MNITLMVLSVIGMVWGKSMLVIPAVIYSIIVLDLFMFISSSAIMYCIEFNMEIYKLFRFGCCLVRELFIIYLSPRLWRLWLFTSSWNHMGDGREVVSLRILNYDESEQPYMASIPILDNDTERLCKFAIFWKYFSHYIFDLKKFIPECTTQKIAICLRDIHTLKHKTYIITPNATYGRIILPRDY
jgi:hypothetical protein